MNCDLLFNVGDAYTPPINEAIIALQEPYDADWPLDAINQGLKISYDYNMVLPWIHVVYDGDGVIGYIVMPRDNRIENSGELYERFWHILRLNQLADDYTFTCDLPAICQGDINGVTVGVVAHISKYGPAIPAGAIGTAISQIMSQTDWLSSAVVWLYPVRKLDSTWTSGIWIATQADDLADNPQMDDLMFTRIRDLNNIPKIHDHYPQFAPRRFT